MHGFAVSHLEFEDFWPGMESDFDIFAFDWPGGGESDKPSPTAFEYGFATLAEFGADVLAAAGISRAHVMGHSMGGGIAALFAATHPELVRSLVLIDPLIFAPEKTLKNQLPLIPGIGPLFFKQLYGRSIFRAYFRDDVFAPGAKVSMDRVDAFYDMFNTPACRESSYALLKAIVDPRPVAARLGLIQAPTQIIWGELDRILPASMAQQVAKAIRGAQVSIVRTGHSPHEESPAEIVGLVKRFLSTVS